MNLYTFIREKIGLKEISNILESLHRIQIHELTLFESVDESVSHLSKWMPFYFFPIGKFASSLVGLQVRPDDIAIQPGTILVASLQSRTLIEIAPSIEAFCYRVMLNWEGYLNYENEPHSPMIEAITLMNQLFQPDFYQAGRHGNFAYYEEDISPIMVTQFKTVPFDYAQMLFFADTPSEKLAFLEQSNTTSHSCLHLFAHQAELLNELAQYQSAMQLCIKALQCYHYTAYKTAIPKVYELAQGLVSKFPTDISPELAMELQVATNELNRFKWIASYVEKNHIEMAIKLLDDLCYDVGNYQDEVVAKFLKEQYQRMNWSWAVDLMELRSFN